MIWMDPPWLTSKKSNGGTFTNAFTTSFTVEKECEINGLLVILKWAYHPMKVGFNDVTLPMTSLPKI